MKDTEEILDELDITDEKNEKEKEYDLNLQDVSIEIKETPPVSNEEDSFDEDAKKTKFVGLNPLGVFSDDDNESIEDQKDDENDDIEEEQSQDKAYRDKGEDSGTEEDEEE